MQSPDMIRSCFLIVVAASVVTATFFDAKPEYCEDYHKDCPVDETANSTVTHLPYEKDCHKFYKCDFGRACVFSCPKFNNGTRQLVFNPELQVCDYPWNVPGLPNCPGSPTVPSTSSPTNAPPTGGPTNAPPSGVPTNAPPTEEPITDSSPTDKPTVPATNSPPTTPEGGISNCLGGCPVRGRGRVRHLTKCNYYYDCFDGDYVLRKCLENLYFNCYIQECDRKESLPADYPCDDISLDV